MYQSKFYKSINLIYFINFYKNGAASTYLKNQKIIILKYIKIKVFFNDLNHVLNVFSIYYFCNNIHTIGNDYLSLKISNLCICYLTKHHIFKIKIIYIS